MRLEAALGTDVTCAKEDLGSGVTDIAMSPSVTTPAMA